jgi:hypothetical protein
MQCQELGSNPRPFSKGQYHVILPTYDGNWYLLISKSIVSDIHEIFSNFKKSTGGK